MDVVIQPFYLSDNRKSEPNELNAIQVISSKLRNNPNTVADIKELIYISFNDRESDSNITQAFNNLLKQDFMGSQYEWLGVFAAKHPGIEMSIHKDDKAIFLIDKHGSLKKECNDFEGDYYVIDREHSQKDLVTVFGNLHFPLADYTKTAMKKEYESMGLSNIIYDTWFCFNPIDNKPCGSCHPCRYTIEEGMPERFSKEALQRYRRSNSVLYKNASKIYHRIKKYFRR